MNKKSKSPVQVKKKFSIKEVKYHFSWLSKILLFLTSPLWIIPVIIVNLVIGKKIRDSLQIWPKNGPVPFVRQKGLNLNTLEFYNYSMRIRKASKQLFISSQEWTQINPQDVDITTFDGTTLAAFLLLAPVTTNKWVVVAHGWMQNRYDILYLAKPFYDAGYNVLVYDARGHGANVASSCTFGLKEAKDLFYILKFLKEKDPQENLEFALIGNSMGASTILQSLVSYDLIAMGVKCAIFDCGYDNFAHMVKILGMAKIGYHWFWFYYGVAFWLQVKDKFKISDIKPINKLQICAKIPVLFVHGNADRTVPVTMTKRLYQEKIKYERPVKDKFKSEILIVEQASHCGAIISDYDLYSKTALKFVKKWFTKSKVSRKGHEKK